MDRVWPELVWALSKEALGRADTMKVGSPDQKGKHCCCVYMPNCFDPVQVESAGSHLEALLGGLVTHVDLYLKPDAYTHCKIYRQNPWKLSPSLAVRKVRGSPDPHPQHHDRERDRLASCLQALETKSMEAIARHLEDADSRAELLTSLHGVALQPDGELPLIKICDGLKEAKYLSGLLARIFRVIRGLVDEGAAFMLGYKSRVFSYPEFLRMHVANFDLLGDLCLHGIISDRYVDDKLDSTLFERRGNILPEPSTFAFVMRCFHRLAQKLAHARPHLSRRLEEGMQDYKVPSQAKITILTLNVWREKEQQKLRTAILLSALGKLGATICCFQEVTCTVAVDIQRALPNWSSSDPGDGSSVRGYGNLTVVPPGLDVHFARHPFPTQMGRDLVVAELDGLAVGTVHLESANHQSTREEQLTVCAKVMQQWPDMLLLGDFNLQNELEERCLTRLLPGFQDLWPALHPDESGKSSGGRKRDDRALANLSQWQAESVELLFEQPLHPSPYLLDTYLTAILPSMYSNYVNLTPDESASAAHVSDHLGLLTTIKQTAAPESLE
ncbi:unnamed protein product [Symbiodinium natans]|uniref:Endonuclease/exonuclease/phosphatase domain-containing protein n=1 Tax=Symbiodinium natans TaxID=878477 RepID=A0A812KB22_9DINO|nr:unnamed protein product [Symbiodinium natans]